MVVPTNQFQQSPYMREQRKFPTDDLKALSFQVDTSYTDIARNVNQRTIGNYAINFSLVTGEKYYLAGSSLPQQVLRQVYLFTTTAPIPHGINPNTVAYFTSCYGSYYDFVGNSYGVIFATSTAITGQLTFYITPTDIIFVNGGIPAAIVGGILILTWISQY